MPNRLMRYHCCLSNAVTRLGGHRFLVLQYEGAVQPGYGVASANNNSWKSGAHMVDKVTATPAALQLVAFLQNGAGKL